MKVSLHRVSHKRQMFKVKVFAKAKWRCMTNCSSCKSKTSLTASCWEVLTSTCICLAHSAHLSLIRSIRSLLLRTSSMFSGISTSGTSSRTSPSICCNVRVMLEANFCMLIRNSSRNMALARDSATFTCTWTYETVMSSHRQLFNYSKIIILTSACYKMI